MAKKVFIGVLAALMLFAFVACDGGTAASGTITMVKATTSKEYVEGYAMPKTEDFTFTGYTLTGEEVNLPSTQFSDPQIGSQGGDNEYEVTFGWAGAADFGAASGTITMYDAEKVEVAIGTAKPSYYTVTSGTYADEDQEDSDFNQANINGAVITVTYDETKTLQVVVSEANAKELKIVGKFGSGKDDAFVPTNNAADNEGVIPATAGAYTIGVYVNKKLVDTYDVTVEKNYVESTALVVDPDYKLFTDGKKVYEENATSALSGGLSADHVYVTKTMINGQVLKADASEVAWADLPADFDDFEVGTTALTNYGLDDIEIEVNGKATYIYAMYVGGNVPVGFDREIMDDSIEAVKEEVSSVKIVAYDAKLLSKTYDSKENKALDNSTDFSGISVDLKYNSGRTIADSIKYSDTATDKNYTWYVATPEIVDEVVGDSITLTVYVYNTSKTEATHQEVTAEIVKSLEA